MKIGISSWTYPWAIGVKSYPLRDPMTAIGLLERACAMGAQVVQIADNLPLAASMLDPIRRAASGIEIELGTRGAEPANLLRYLEYAVSLGSHFVRTLLGDGYNEDSLRAVLSEFGRHGVVLGLENYEGLPSADLAALMRRLDNPWAGICLDTVNSLGALEMPEFTIKTLAPYTVNVHVKDFDIVRVPYMMGFEVTGRPAGQGRLDLKSLLDQVQVYGRDPNLILEQWPPLTGSLEETIVREAAWAEAGWEYLNTKLNRDHVA
ncbi:MAG: sugar phosphate isomerase/epimerase family protein [Terriglobia bacterium]